MSTAATVWLPMGTAVIGALAGIGGVALGPMLGTRQDHRKWLREKRTERTEEFYSALQAAGRLQHRIGHINEYPNYEPHIVDHTIDRLFKTESKLQLYASKELRELASTTSDAFET